MGQIESKAANKATGKARGKAANKANAGTSVAPASTSVDALTAWTTSNEFKSRALNAYKRQAAARNNLKKNPPKDLTAGPGSALNTCMYASDDADGIDCGYVVSDFLTSPTGCANPQYRKNYSNACNVAEKESGAPAKTRADFEAMQRCYADPKKPECARWGCHSGDDSDFGCQGYSPAHGAVLYNGDRGPFKIPTTNWKNTRNLSDY